MRLFYLHAHLVAFLALAAIPQLCSASFMTDMDSYLSANSSAADGTLSASGINGVWTLGSAPQGASYSGAAPTVGTLTPYTTAQYYKNWPTNASFSGWSTNADPGNHLPAVLVNTSGAPSQPFGTSLAIPVGGVFVHPGPTAASEWTYVQWTAPSTATYSVAANWTQDDSNSTLIQVIEGGTTNATLFGAAATYSGGSAGSAQGATNTYSNGALALSAGDTLTFAVGWNAGGSYISGGTSFNATITPKPAGLPLLLAGAVVGGLWLRPRSTRRAMLS